MSKDSSWDAVQNTANITWVWVPTVYTNANLSPLWYEKDESHPGWSILLVDENKTCVNLPYDTVRELLNYTGQMMLYAIPTGDDLLAINGIKANNTVEMYFETGCSGALTLNGDNCSCLPNEIYVRSNELELTVADTNQNGLEVLNVRCGKVNYTGNIGNLLLEATGEGTRGDVTVNGKIGILGYNGTGTEKPFTGTLTVTGEITSGIMYDGVERTMAIPGITDKFVLSEDDGQTFEGLTGLDNSAIIIYDSEKKASSLNPEIATSGSVVPTYDMFFYNYNLTGRNTDRLLLRPIEGYGYDEPIWVSIQSYNPDFTDNLADNIIWGDRTEIFAVGGEYTLPGKDGKGIKALRVGGDCTITVQCPVEDLVIVPDSAYSGHVTMFLEGQVEYAQLDTKSCKSDITLRNGGSITKGSWMPALREGRYFEKCSTGEGETLTLMSDSTLQVMSRIDHQNLSSILPSDTDVTAAAGTQAMAEVSEKEITTEEKAALQTVADGENTISVGEDQIVSVFDVSIHGYSAETNGNFTKGAEITSLTGKISFTVSNLKGSTDVFVVRIHEKDGALTAEKVDATVTAEKVSFDADQFSTYVVAAPAAKEDDSQQSGEQKTDEQKTDDQKTDDQKTDDQKTDDQKTDDQKTDDQKTDDTEKKEEPDITDPMDKPDFTLPAGILSIDEDAFNGIAAQVVYIPAGTKDAVIRAGAFAKCTKLRQIYIPANVVTIEEGAFDGVESLIIYGEKGSAAETYAKSHDNCRFGVMQP